MSIHLDFGTDNPESARNFEQAEMMARQLLAESGADGDLIDEFIEENKNIIRLGIFVGVNQYMKRNGIKVNPHKVYPAQDF